MRDSADVLSFQTRTGHLSHSTWAGKEASCKRLCAGFKPGRATSPIPPVASVTVCPAMAVFQTRTGHLSHSTLAIQHWGQISKWRFKPGRATSPIPPQVTNDGTSAKERFQTRTGHLSPSTNVVRVRDVLPLLVSNPDGPPLPFHLHRRHESGVPRSVSNPDGPPIPFHRSCLVGKTFHSMCFKPGRATSPIPPGPLKLRLSGKTTFQTRTGHLSHSTGIPSVDQLTEALVSNPDGPPLPFPRWIIAAHNRTRQVSNPDGPPLPFHLRPLALSTSNRKCFKPGRATSPIPPLTGRAQHQLNNMFQTRTGHLSHSTFARCFY